MKKLLIIIGFVMVNVTQHMVAAGYEQLEQERALQEQQQEEKWQESYHHWMTNIIPGIEKEMHEKIGQGQKADHSNLLKLDFLTENKIRGLCRIKSYLDNRKSSEDNKESGVFYRYVGALPESESDPLISLFKAFIHLPDHNSGSFDAEINKIIDCKSIIAD